METVLLALAGPGVALATLVYTIVSQRRKANADQLAALGQKFGEADKRLTQIEGRIESLPDRDATHRLELSLAEMRGDLKALTERIGPMAATSARLQNFLLEQAK
nr:DUF2730 family protein [Rhodoplanes tepidamans]